MERLLEPEDVLLLCSDGLWKAFKETDELAKQIFNNQYHPAELCKTLINQANELDGSDNISLIIVSAFSSQAGFRQVKTSISPEKPTHEVVPV